MSTHLSTASRIILTLMAVFCIVQPLTARASNCFTQSLSHTAYDQFGYPGQRSVAQQFTVSGTCTVTDVSFNGSIHGSPSSVPTAFIEPNAANQPSGTILATSDTISMNTAATETAHFSSPATLSAGTYWFVLTTDTTDSSSYWQYGGNYPHSAVDVLASASQGATWFDETYTFEYLSVDNNPPVVPPSPLSGDGTYQVNLPFDGTLLDTRGLPGPYNSVTWFFSSTTNFANDYYGQSAGQQLGGVAGQDYRTNDSGVSGVISPTGFIHTKVYVDPSTAATQLALGKRYLFIVMNDCQSTTGVNCVYGSTATTTEYYQGFTFDASSTLVALSGGVSLSGNRIDTVTPAAGATVATSTGYQVVSATGNVSSGDFVSGLTKITFCLQRAGARFGSDVFAPVALGQVDAGCGIGGVSVVLGSSGSFSISATTTQSSADIGTYVFVSRLTSPLFSAFGFGAGSRLLAATTTTFTFATSTLGDKIALGRLNLVESLNEASSTAGFVDNCYPTAGNFSFTSCFLGIFVPDGVEFSVLGDDVMAILSTGPWGFVGTTLGIIKGDYSGAASVSDLPILTVDLKDSHLPATSGVQAIVISPWSQLLGASSILSTATSTKDGATIRSIVEPGWRIFVMISFFLLIFFDVMRITSYVTRYE